jgi:hypothetical protein
VISQIERGLARIVDQHRSAFGLLHHYLQWAVEQTYAMWEPHYPDSSSGEPHGGVFAGCVRQILAQRCEGPAFARQAATLRLEPGPNCSIALVAAGGMEIRVRKVPAGGVKDAPEWFQEGLFDGLPGLSPVEPAWQPMVFWDRDRKAAAMRSAVLAAVSVDEDGEVLVKYGDVALPDPVAPEIPRDSDGLDGPDGSEGEGWDEEDWPKDGPDDLPA